MFKFKGEVFSSDGTYAVMREDGTDIVNVSRVEHFGADDNEQGLESHNGFRSSDAEYQEVINRIHAALKDDGPWSHLRDLDGAVLAITLASGKEVEGPISFNADRPGTLTISPDDHVWTDISLAHIVAVEWRDQ